MANKRAKSKQAQQARQRKKSGARAEAFVDARAALHLKYHGTVLDAERVMADQSAVSRRAAISRDKAPSQAPTAPFLRVPREVRTMIYSYVVAEPGKTFFLDTAMPPPLARVCQQIRAECLPFFLSENDFHVFFEPRDKRHVLDFLPTTTCWIQEIGREKAVLKSVSLFTKVEQDPQILRPTLDSLVAAAESGVPPTKLVGLYTMMAPEEARTHAFWDVPGLHLQHDKAERAVKFHHYLPHCRVCSGSASILCDPEWSQATYLRDGLIKGMRQDMSAERHHMMCDWVSRGCGIAGMSDGISVKALAKFAGMLSIDAFKHLLDLCDLQRFGELLTLADEGHQRRKAAEQKAFIKAMLNLKMGESVTLETPEGFEMPDF